MDIDTILDKWLQAKKHHAIYEKECNKYKEAVENYMNKKSIDKIEGKNLNLTRRFNTRECVSKDALPPDIWVKYAKKFTYYSYHIK
jgi:hypothetical protein